LDEKKLAEKQVLSKLIELGFDESLIPPYGTYSIRVGSSTRMVDYIVLLGMEEAPYLVVEVKVDSDDFDLPQVQSYALLVNAPFFALTNGNIWKFYLNGGELERYIEIDQVPMPLEIIGDHDKQGKLINKILELVEYLDGQDEHWFYRGLEYHMEYLDELESGLKDPLNLSRRELIDLLTSLGIMNDKRNQPRVIASILYSEEKVKKSLIHLINSKLPLEKRYDNLVRKDSQYKINGIGPLSVTRILASIDYNCFSIDNKVLRQLARLGVCSPRSRPLTGREYSKLVEYFTRLHDYKNFKDHGMELLHYILWKWDELNKEIK